MFDRHVMCRCAISVILTFSFLLGTGRTANGEAADYCIELRPQRDVEILTEGRIELGLNVLRGWLADPSTNIEGEFSFREKFAEYYAISSLPAIERFYYLVCLAIADGDIAPERRLALLLKAERERKSQLESQFQSALTSENVSEATEAIEFGVAQGGSFAQIAIHEGLASEKPEIVDKAVSSAFLLKKTFSGIFLQSASQNERTESFTLEINSVENLPFGANIMATLRSGVFKRQGPSIKMSGSVSGGTISLSSDQCSITMWRREGAVFDGKMSCIEKFKMHYDFHEQCDVWMKLF